MGRRAAAFVAGSKLWHSLKLLLSRIIRAASVDGGFGGGFGGAVRYTGVPGQVQTEGIVR